MNSISSKIFYGIIVCIIASTSLLCLLSINFVRTNNEQLIMTELSYVSRYYAQTFSTEILTVEENVKSLKLYIEDIISTNGLKNNPHYLKLYSEKLSDYVKTIAEKSIESKSAWVYFDPKWSDSPQDIFYIDENDDGKVERQPKTDFSFFNTPSVAGEKQWWLTPKNSRKSIWTNVYQKKLSNGKTLSLVSYCAPIIIDGHFIGVVGADYKLGSVLSAIKQIQVNNTGYASLYNENYDVIIHPTYFAGNESSVQNLRTLEGSRFEYIADEIANKDHGIIPFISTDNVERLFIYSKLTNGWIFSLNPAVSDVYAGYNELIYKIVLGLFASILLSIIFAFYIGKSITRPIVQVIKGAQRLGSGKLETTIEVETNDEIKILANALNNMTNNMQNVITDLKQSNEYTESIIDFAQLCTFEIDFEVGVIKYNNQWNKLWAFTGKNEGFRPLQQLVDRIHPEHLSLVDQMGGTVPGEVMSAVVRVLAYDNEWRWHSLMWKAKELSKEGKVISVIGLATDVTSQKVREFKEAEQKKMLESLVAERTKELTISRDQAEAASKAKTAFLSTVSHEIRTPMNAIVGFTHIFERTNLTSTQINYLDKIQLSAGALLNIINDVLDISKIEAGKLELANSPMQLQSIVNTVHSIIGFSAADKGLKININFEDDVPTALIGDQKRLSQILLNLFNNAIKFTAKGSISLRVFVKEPVQDEHILIGFELTDTGIGLTDEQRSRLFKPFSQADNTISRSFGGTGLGLAICKKLAELMGGDIGVNSVYGQGSTFWFTIKPKVTSQEEFKNSISEANISLKSSDDEELKFDGVNILVVEDNDINQEIAMAFLEPYGFVIDIANNGKEAVDMVKKKQYRCIFMDMQMPVMDGVEATINIRKLGEKAEFDYLLNTPIIAMTANAMNEDKERCLAAGMNGHITKPIDPNDIKINLKRYLIGNEQ